MRKITPSWYVMYPFRQWAAAQQVVNKGFFAVLSNTLAPVTGNPLKYDI